jgi:hypothetical protein
MEIFGGFMVMMSIISLFLAVVWLIMPFVVFAIKGKQDRTLEILEGIEARLAIIEAHFNHAETENNKADLTGQGGTSAERPVESSCEHTLENSAIHPESTAEKNESGASPEVPKNGGF